MTRYELNGEAAALKHEVKIETNSHFCFSDMSNAERFSSQHYYKARYCYENKTWFIWNGFVWSPDTTGQVFQLAKATVKKMYNTPSNIDDDVLRKRSASSIKDCESLTRRKAMIEDAKSELALRAEDFDSNINRITCLDKTINLKTLEAYEPEHNDFITKQMKVKYNPDADCPQWEKLLKLVFDNDRDMIDYFQKAVGYALTGDTSAECMFLLLGSGENGKSTIVRTLATLFGDYAYKTPVDTLIAVQGANKKPALAHLKGVRFLYASESEVGDKISIATIKELTGGETITGCHKYEKETSFLPQCTLFFSSNNEPIISGSDYGTWRRIVRIPFNVRISDVVDVVRSKEEVISELEEELSGIFNWALNGLKKYWKEGLGNKPQAVSEATDTYQKEQDRLTNFLEDRCSTDLTGKKYKVTVADLYSDYEDWSEKNKEEPLTKNQFGKELKSKGVTQERTGQSRFWLGISLRDNDEK